MDSLYTHRLGNDNRLYSGALDYTWQINGKSAFKAGAKAVYSFMDDYTHYYSERDGGRSEIADYGNEGRMKETVGAVYAAFSSAAGKAFRYSAGLRGEYTVAKPENRKTRRTEKQDYFDLFPSVSLSATLPSKRPQFLALNYSRKIARPSFSQLIPFRISGGNNIVLEGNPQLKPSYINTVSLSWAYDDNYSVAIGMEDAKNVIERLMSVDKQSGSEIVRRPENVARRIKWYANVTFPVSLVRWWKIYLDVYGTLEKLRMPQKNIYGSRLMINFTNIINLSKTFTWNTHYFFYAPRWDGNVRTGISHGLITILSARFAEGRVTASVFVDNVFEPKAVKMSSVEDGFESYRRIRYCFRQIGFSLRYNFESGRKVKVREVQSGAEEERRRLE